MAAERPPGEHLLYLPTGHLLRYLSLDQAELVADLIFLWSIQYYGNYAGGVRYDYVMQIFDQVITELDPRFEDAYLLGALILSAEARQPDKALRLLDKGIQANASDWVLPFEAGFIAYHQKRDYKRAADYFRVSMERPGAHPAVRRFHAEMFNRADDKRTSLANWQNILDTAESNYVRQVAAKHVHDLTLEIHLDLLRTAIERYREANGVLPRALVDLLKSGLLPALPIDPSGHPYRYDPATGEVSSLSRFQLQRLGGGS